LLNCVIIHYFIASEIPVHATVVVNFGIHTVIVRMFCCSLHTPT